MEKTHIISTKSFKDIKVTIYINKENIRCADVTHNNKFIGTAEYASPYPTDPDLLEMYKETLEEWIIKQS